MELETPLDVIGRIIGRTGDRDAQTTSGEPEEIVENGQVLADDDYDVPIDDKTDSVEQEISAALDGLTEDQRAELLALAWIGNGTFDVGDWDEAISEASDPKGDSSAEQLMDMPMLAAYLEAGLEAFDLSWDAAGAIG